jgi:hypothetical protein
LWIVWERNGAERSVADRSGSELDIKVWIRKCLGEIRKKKRSRKLIFGFIICFFLFAVVFVFCFVNQYSFPSLLGTSFWDSFVYNYILHFLFFFPTRDACCFLLAAFCFLLSAFCFIHNGVGCLLLELPCLFRLRFAYCCFLCAALVLEFGKQKGLYNF